MRWRDWNRRQALHGQGEMTTEASPGELELPPATARGVDSFYRLRQRPLPALRCTGTACSRARGWPAGNDQGVQCLGRCYAAPATLDEQPHAIPTTSLLDPPILLTPPASTPTELAALYRRPAAEQILRRIEDSGLRGRGGAAFATGRKWRVAAQTAAGRKHVVANADEGDPGAFVDRLLLETRPHAVLAGLAACAAAIGANSAIVYVRAEYPRASRRMRQAIVEARPWLPDGLEVSVHDGAGSYVAGEETALLRAIEGLRAEPRPKPPYPAERGLYGEPTVVQNVETLAAIPWVLEHGRRPGVKGFSLSGAIARPGVVEAPFGLSLAELLQRGGGGPARGSRWTMALVGGPMGQVLSVDEFDTPLTHSRLPGMGHGGIVVCDQHDSPAQLARHLTAFAASESCGSCTPCRVGTAQLAHCRNRSGLLRLLQTMEMGSLCAFGQSVPRPLRDLLRLYGDAIFEETAHAH